MDKNKFWITTGRQHPQGDRIYGLKNKLQIHVHQPDDFTWSPTPGQVQLYAIINKQLFVFETVAVTPDDALDMPAAIYHYGDYVGAPNLLILTKEPRLDSHHTRQFDSSSIKDTLFANKIYKKGRLNRF